MEKAKTVRAVATKSELKSALRDKVDEIFIIDAKLAKQVRAFKSAKKAAVVAVFGAGGVAAVNAWNPVGWGTAAAGLGIVGAASLTTGGTAIIAMAVLGSLGLIMYMGYELKAGGGAEELPGESGATRKINFHVKLTRKD